MRLLPVALLMATALLAACSNTRRCESEQAYQKAETLATPGAVPGLTVPESPSALRIPPAPASSEPFGKKVRDPADPDSTRYECLDMPPRLAGEAAPAKGDAKMPLPEDDTEKKKHWWWPW